MINGKVKLKLKWTKYCVLSVGDKDNEIANDGNAYIIIFTIKDIKLYVPLVNLSSRDNQKLSKLISKGFERSVYWNEYKTKKKSNKNTTNQFWFLRESNFSGVNGLFVLVYSNQDAASRRFKAKRYYLPKGIMDNYNVIINGKSLYDHPVLFRYKTIKRN